MSGMSTPAAKRAGASTSFQLERGWGAAGKAGEGWREAGGELEGGWGEAAFSGPAAAAAAFLSLFAPAWCRLQTIVDLHVTAVGLEPTPLRNGALSHRLRPLGQTVLMKLARSSLVPADNLPCAADKRTDYFQ